MPLLSLFVLVLYQWLIYVVKNNDHIVNQISLMLVVSTIVTFAAYLLPACIKSFYMLSDSYHSAAPLWIGTGLKFCYL